MNWDALGAVGEIAGAIGVILTLMYLARQIHESNRTARQSATQEVQNQVVQWVYQVNSTKELTELWLRGNIDDESLSLIELIQFRAIYSQLINLWERAYSLKKEGRMDLDFWQTLVLSRKNFLASAGFKSFWNDRADHYGVEFRDSINAEFADANTEWSPLGVDLSKFDLASNLSD